MKKNVPLQYIRGDDSFWTIVFRDKSESPIDLTGFTVSFTVKKSPKDTQGQAIIAKSYSNISDPELGKVVIDILKGDALGVGNYYYDVETVDAADFVSTPIIGKIEVIQDITT